MEAEEEGAAAPGEPAQAGRSGVGASRSRDSTCRIWWFVGVSAMVRMQRHIHVDFLYRLLPPRIGRALSTLVDIVRILFFAYATVLTGQMMSKMTNYKMTIVDLPMNVVYAVCLFGFACSAIRAVQVAVEHWRQGYSVLERPEFPIESSI